MKKISKILVAILAVVCCTVLFACNVQTEPIKKSYTVSVIDGKGGGVFEEGTKVSVVANEKGEFYDFIGWYEGEAKLSDSKTYEFEVEKDIILKATYNYDPYKNLSAKEADDLTNDLNRGIYTTESLWDKWPTTLEEETTEVSPLNSEKAVKMTIAPGKDGNGELIDEATFQYGGVWSQAKFGFMKNATLDLTKFGYVEFDVKMVNAQNWLAILFLDAEGNKVEIGGDLPKFDGGEAKMLNTNGWYHVVINYASKLNVEYLLNEDNELSADQLKTLKVLQNCVEVHTTFSDCNADQTKATVVYIDNLHVTATPFDASELDTQAREAMAKLLKEEEDGTNKMTIAYEPDWNPGHFSWTKGEEYSKGGDSTYGYQLLFPAREGDDQWPRVQFNLNQIIDFTANDVTIDVKCISNHPWLMVYYYDKDWTDIGPTTSQDFKAGEWTTLKLEANCDNVGLLAFCVTSKGTNVANEIWFDNLTVTPKASTHPNKAEYVADTGFHFNVRAEKADFAGEGKGVSFEFTMTEGVTKFALMDGPHDWANYTGNITLTRVGDDVTCDKGEVEAIENGWYRVTIPYAAFAGDADEKVPANDGITMMYYRWADNVTAEHVYVDKDSLKACTVGVAKHVNKAAYTGPQLNFATPLAKSEFAGENKGVSFEFKMTEGVTKFALMDGPHSWANYTSNITLTRTGDVVTCDKGTVEDLGDGWFKVTIPYANFGGDADEAVPANDAITMMYYKWVENITASEVLIDLDSLKGEKISHTNKVLYEKNNTFDEYKINLAEALVEGTGIYFEFTMTDGEMGFCLMADWANITGNFKVTKNGDAISCNNGGIVEDIGDGWYSLTMPKAKFSGDGDTSNAAEKFINRIYYKWDTTAETTYIDMSAAKVVVIPAE